jgi:hypothetical protein
LGIGFFSIWQIVFLLSFSFVGVGELLLPLFYGRWFGSDQDKRHRILQVSMTLAMKPWEHKQLSYNVMML